MMVVCKVRLTMEGEIEAMKQFIEADLPLFATQRGIDIKKGGRIKVEGDLNSLKRFLIYDVQEEALTT